MDAMEQQPAAQPDSQTVWDRPGYTLPAPKLELLFHLECNMESFMRIGDGPHGDRFTVIFKGGRFEGPKLRGQILPGGGDWEIIRNHDGDQQTAHLDTRYNLKTHDGAVIYLQTTGSRTGKRQILESLGERELSPTEYRMRLNIKAECGHPRYTWLNQAVIIASAARVGSTVIYDAYQVL